ncbi:Asynaptic protein [Quillaja saponaria]|uniref:Asynaptic protein n=1 Tax=Quillaja saponaria TaxID=32244 RepID=A0AAD7VJF2_QUISA|nr:Asynaptic protein [Quillaja saponaria]
MRDCKSFGSNCRPSSQSRKISIGVVVDSVANRRSGTMKESEAIKRNTQRVISNIETPDGDKNKDKGVTAATSLNQKVPGEVKSSQITVRSLHQRAPTSETIPQATHDANLLVSGGMQDKVEGIEMKSVPVKCSFQLFSNQTSIFQSSDHNPKKFDARTCKRKGNKDGTAEKVEEFTAQQVCKSDEANIDDRTNKTENRTETLRLKLWEILDTVSSHKNQHLRSQIHNIDEGHMQPERHLDQKDDKQTSDTIETDSENPDHIIRRPVTRSLTRKKAPTKGNPRKIRGGPSSSDKQKQKENNILSFEEKLSAKPRDFLEGDSSMSSRKKGQRKNSTIGLHKLCFPVNDNAGKVQLETSRSDTPLHLEETSLLWKKMASFQGFLPKKQKKCLESEKDFLKECYRTPLVNKTDHQGQSDSSAEGEQEDGRDNLFTENNANQKDNFQSPTIGFRTPPLGSSLSSMPKTDKMVNDVSGPATDEKIFSLGNIRNLRTFQISGPECRRSNKQIEDPDMKELKYSEPRKEPSFLEEKDEQDAMSDSSSEEGDFGSSQEGSRERDKFPLAGPAEKQKFILHPINRLCIHEGIKVNDNSPVSPSPKETKESDWIHGTSGKSQEDVFARAVELFVSELGKLKSKIQSVTNTKSSEILKSVAEEIQLQLQNVQSQIYKDMGKLTSLSKSKRKRLETRFEDQQKQLRLIHEKFKEELNQHLQECISTVENFEAHMIEFKGTSEKQRVSHRKLLSQLEEATEIQLNDAQKKITAIQELARGKMLQLKHVIALCLKEGIIR